MKCPTLLRFLAAATTMLVVVAEVTPDMLMDEDDNGGVLPVPLTICVERCLNRTHRIAGCGQAQDWVCLCRSNQKLAPEVARCMRANCRGEKEKGVIRGIEAVYCSQTYTDKPLVPKEGYED